MPETQSQVQPRAKGGLILRSKARAGQSAIDHLRSKGCLKALFPHKADRVEAIVINTAGGLTGGDHLVIEAVAGAGSQLTLTTQAAERAYKATSDVARAQTRLQVAQGARLNWLPQELILFEQAALNRSLCVDMARDARLLMVEPVVFGRAAMGETLRHLSFRDRIEIRRDGAPLYLDAVRLEGDVTADMARLGQGAGAMASVVYVAPDAEAQLAPTRSYLPATGGASLVRQDVLVMRLLAGDSFELRRALLPILDRLSGDALPTSWRL